MERLLGLLPKANYEDDPAIRAPDFRQRCFGGEHAQPVAIEILNRGQDVLAVYDDASGLIGLRFVASPGSWTTVENVVPLLLGQ